MKKWQPTKTFAALFALLFGFSNVINAQVNIVTQHNDLRRTGWNANEKTLNHSNVNSKNFGKVFTRQVDDQIYAQPLVVSKLTINNKVRNVVLTATVNNSVYAFDADLDTANTPLWKVSLTPPGYRSIRNTDMTGACGGGYNDFSGNMGIVGTPVIDTNTKTLYVVARSVTKDGNKRIFVQYLHALDIRTGLEKPNSPVYITATVNGSGAGSVNGEITFNQQKQNQRPGLLLYNGVVYISWASHCDWGPYHGWVIGYDANTLQRRYVYNDTPNGKNGGIWMSGQAPAVDDNGFIYISTGNGTVGGGGKPNKKINRGESILKLSTSTGNLSVVDFFTPADYEWMEEHDLDLGIDGVLLVPNTTLALSGSKQSIIYVVNTNKMGHMTSNNSGAVQQINYINSSGLTPDRHLHGGPAYFKSFSGKEFIYSWSEYGLLNQIPFVRNDMLFDTTSIIYGKTVLPSGMPGAMLSVSSNQLNLGTGILWASHPLTGDASHEVVPGILQAFDANDVTTELWNSNQIPGRDSIGKFAKFVCPTIANGKVYMATFSNKLVAYGLLPSANNLIAKQTNLDTKTNSDAKLSIYPNPAQRQLTLDYKDNSAVTGERVLVDIYSNTGFDIYRKELSINLGGTFHLNIALPATVQNGVYTVRVTNAQGISTVEKLVISN